MTRTIDELILQDKTRSNLNEYLRDPTHALMLIGAKGVGLGTIAKALAYQVAGNEVILIEPTIHDKQKTKVINIEDIRQVYGAHGHRRADKMVIVIDDIDSITHDAPQAFLKLLEEPSDNVLYILTAHETSSIPTTITSRAQIITVIPPDEKACQSILSSSPLRLTDDKRKRILFMAGGHPAELTRLVNDETYYREKAESFEKAKNLLTADVLGRLKVISSVSNRAEGIELARNLSRIMLVTAKSESAAKSLGKKFDTISRVIDNLSQNGNLRIQMLFLVMNV